MPTGSPRESLRSNLGDFDYLWAGIAALARIAPAEPKVRKFLAALVPGLEKGSGAKGDRPAPQFRPREMDPRLGRGEETLVSRAPAVPASAGIMRIGTRTKDRHRRCSLGFDGLE